jgi:hypothetical protein
MIFTHGQKCHHPTARSTGLPSTGYRICSTNTAWHTWSLAAGLMDFDLSGTGTAVPIVFRGWAIR